MWANPTLFISWFINFNINYTIIILLWYYKNIHYSYRQVCVWNCANSIKLCCVSCNTSFFIEDFSRKTETLHIAYCTKNKFSINDLFSKCDQIRSFLRLWSHLPKKSFMENLIFCTSVNSARVIIGSARLIKKFLMKMSVCLLFLTPIWMFMVASLIIR